MDESPDLRRQIPRAALLGFAAIVGLALARLTLFPSAGPRVVHSVPFVFGTFHPASLDIQTMARGSTAHDGVEHHSTLTPPLVSAWHRHANAGEAGRSAPEPAVDSSGVYLGTDTGWLHALTHAGETRWSYFDGSAPAGVTGAPATDSSAVYFGTSAGNLVALDKVTGHVIWLHHLDGTLAGAPILSEDGVYATVSRAVGSSFVLRVRRTDGVVEWQSGVIEAFSASGPALDLVTNLVLVGARDHRVHAFDRKTGARVWARELDADVDATPTLVGGQVLVTTRGEYAYALRAKTGESVWKSQLSGGSSQSPTWEPAANVLVVGTNRGEIHGLDRHTGKSRWVRRTGTASSAWAGALAVSKTKRDQSARLVWIPCGETRVCALDPRTGDVLERISTGGVVASSPVVFGDALYVVEAAGALRKFVTRQ